METNVTISCSAFDAKETTAIDDSANLPAVTNKSITSADLN